MPSVSIEDTTSESALTAVRTPLLSTDRVFLTVGSVTYKGTLADILAFIDSNIDLSAYATISSVDTALSGKCPLVEGKVPSANLPSYIDDVLEFDDFASFPVTGETGKIYVDTSTDFVYRWSGSAYFQLGSSGGGSGIREDVTFTSGSIVANASVSGTVSISPRYQLLQITTNYPCRVRLYTSTAKRDADLTRPIGTDPTGNHGLLFEFMSTTELLNADLSPLVDGFADTAAIAYSITNLSGATQTITVTLNHVKTGA